MKTLVFAPRQVRSQYRHDLRTLTYVTLDDANGGIVRNLSDKGVAVQAVAALRPQQLVRLRFEPSRSKVRIDVHGEVTWADSSGQCGIRFLDLSPRARRQLNQWIFGNLLESIPQDAARTGSIFSTPASDTKSPDSSSPEESDGLLVSSSPRPVIQLEPESGSESEANLRRGLEIESSPQAQPSQSADYECIDRPDLAESPAFRMDWLSRPLSGRSLALLVDSLVVTAGLLVFSLVFLATAHELPSWTVTLAGLAAAWVFVTAAYWTLLKVFGGLTLGSRAANYVAHGRNDQMEKEATRFR